MDQALRICPVCRMGRMKPADVTYINQYGETVVSAQKIPAWTCDVCHETEFDEVALQRMELLLGQGLLPPNRYRPAPARKHGPGVPNEGQSPAKSKRAGNRKASAK